MKLAVVATLILGTAAGAYADSHSRSKLFPLTSPGAPRSMRPAAAELTRVLSRSLGAETTAVPIDDAAQMMACSLADTSCLEGITKSVGAKRILFGEVVIRGDGARIELTTFESGKGSSQRTIELLGETVDALAESLRDELAGELSSRPTRTTPTPRTILDTPVTPPATTDTGPTTGTWALIVGGGITAGVGVGFLVSANNLNGRAARAPTATKTEIQRLVNIEKARDTRLVIGGAATAVGAIVTAIGVVRMIRQNRAARPDEPRLDVVPESGGASVVFTMGWR